MMLLAATYLPLGNRPDPHEHGVENNDHYAHDPEDTSIVGLVIAEDDGEDDSPKVAGSSNKAGEDACRYVSVNAIYYEG
jgi:hypothetical protein